MTHTIRAELASIRAELDRLDAEHASMVMRIATLSPDDPDYQQQLTALTTHALDLHDRQRALHERLDINQREIQRL